MMILVATIIILAYMINNLFGLGMMFVYVFTKFAMAKRGTMIQTSLSLMIMALPMAYIGFAGTTMHQVFSWYNMFLVLFIFVVIASFAMWIPIKKLATSLIVTVVFCLFINMIWTNNISGSLVEIAQLLVMVIPILIIHTLRDKLDITHDTVCSLIGNYVDVCVATAIAMLAQYVMYYIFGMRIGIIHFTGGGRVAFYALFRGASILPVYMGIGIVYLFIECFEKKVTRGNLIKMVIIFMAVVLNTSRTGLFALMAVMVLISIKYIIKAPSAKGIFISILGFVGAYFAINYITTLRSKLTSFLDANGRIATWNNGIKIWLANIKNFFLGEGFTGERWDGVTKPHNMVIQTLAQCGIIVAVILTCMMIKYLVDHRRNPYVFIPMYIILAGMFVTDFYANAFTTVILILLDLYYGTLIRENVIKSRTGSEGHYLE